jgi:hypothetical protein
MNGATAEPPPITNKMPMNMSSKITGVNHHFFRADINFRMSLRNSILSIVFEASKIL